MPEKAPWTLGSLERALRREFVARGRVRFKALPKAAAQVQWTDGGTIKADLDPFSVGHLSGVIHELMHIVLQDELKPFAEYGVKGKRELGELAIEAWEAGLAEEILASPRRKAWWRKAIVQAMK